MSDELRAWISQEKDRRGWSYRELARRAGISQSLVSRTVSGEVPPSADFCIRIAQALGEAPEKVLRLAGILPASDNDPTLTELQDTVKNLPKKKRKQALDYLRFLLQSDKEE